MVKAVTTNNRLTPKQIKQIVDDNQNKLLEYAEQEKYYKGKNNYILNVRPLEPFTKTDGKNSKIWELPIAYGRKIVKTISGYMYKPGLITFTTENKKDKQFIDELFKQNNEPILNNKLGVYNAVNGLSYELHYIPREGEFDYKMTMVKAKNALMVYNYDIDPEKIAFIRIVNKANEINYEVYYNDIVITYLLTDTGLKKIEKDKLNPFGVIPVIDRINNEERIGDIEIVKILIDAYDVINSSSMIEFDKFAYAYLKIVGSGIKDDDLKKAKLRRIFANLDDKDAISWLTKNIPTDFIEKTADRIKREIHRQSFIPDIDEIKFGGSASGVTVDKFIYLMEYSVSDKEAYFRKGLMERFELIQKFNPALEDIYSIKIDFARNIPQSDTANAEIYAKLDGKGISRKTMMGHLFSWIEDPEKELKKFEEEADARAKKAQTMFGDNTDEEEEIQGDTKTVEE